MVLPFLSDWLFGGFFVVLFQCLLNQAGNGCRTSFYSIFKPEIIKTPL